MFSRLSKNLCVLTDKNAADIHRMVATGRYPTARHAVNTAIEMLEDRVTREEEIDKIRKSEKERLATLQDD